MLVRKLYFTEDSDTLPYQYFRVNARKHKATPDTGSSD